MELAFFDTNIFVYADDAASPQKQVVAFSLIRTYRNAKRLMLSVQVMQEYFNTTTRKLGFPAAVAQRKLEIIRSDQVITLNDADVVSAIELHRLSNFSFWDALIVHAARKGGATVLYSEDFQHGSVVSGVRVVNPFLEA